jgi:hypothetical protein
MLADEEAMLGTNCQPMYTWSRINKGMTRMANDRKRSGKRLKSMKSAIEQNLMRHEDLPRDRDHTPPKTVHQNKADANHIAPSERNQTSSRAPRHSVVA